MYESTNRVAYTSPGNSKWHYCSKLCSWSYWMQLANGPRREKTCLRGFRWSDIQNRLLSYRDKLENQNFACSKFRYDTFQKANNKGADQSAGMRRLVCAFVVRKPPKTGFLASRPKYTMYWGSCMCAHVLLNLLKELSKSDKMRDLPTEAQDSWACTFKEWLINAFEPRHEISKNVLSATSIRAVWS